MTTAVPRVFQQRMFMIKNVFAVALAASFSWSIVHGLSAEAGSTTASTFCGRAHAANQLAAVPASHAQSSIDWQPWSDDLFAKARAEKKMVLMDLHAVWCHWCHVMDETTYRNSRVIQCIQRNFIAVSVDQDSR